MGNEVEIEVEPVPASCGALIRGVDLGESLSDGAVAKLRRAWLRYHVLVFPDQAIDDDDLERVTQHFGPFGDDPFIAPIAGREHVIAVKRRADETAPLFAENWHSDWSFQAHPPDGTMLRAVTIPPHGGDTLFANQTAALAAMPDAMRARIADVVAIHSARGGYAPSGMYGTADQATDRSMDIRPSDTARATQTHPLVRRHPETGRESLFGCIGYIVGLEGFDDEPARDLLVDLLQWQSRDEFVYRHSWQPNMVVMWDNRCVLHRATGGYEGFDRELHRTTIGYAPDHHLDASSTEA